MKVTKLTFTFAMSLIGRHVIR